MESLGHSCDTSTAHKHFKWHHHNKVNYFVFNHTIGLLFANYIGVVVRALHNTLHEQDNCITFTFTLALLLISHSFPFTHNIRIWYQPKKIDYMQTIFFYKPSMIPSIQLNKDKNKRRLSERWECYKFLFPCSEENRVWFCPDCKRDGKCSSTQCVHDRFVPLTNKVITKKKKKRETLSQYVPDICSLQDEMFDELHHWKLIVNYT